MASNYPPAEQIGWTTQTTGGPIQIIPDPNVPPGHVMFLPGVGYAVNSGSITTGFYTIPLRYFSYPTTQVGYMTPPLTPTEITETIRQQEARASGYMIPPLNPTEITEALRRQEELARARAAKDAEAEGKARALLLSVLSPEQRKTFEGGNFFDIEIPPGKKLRWRRNTATRIYRLRYGRYGNITVWNKDRIQTASICIGMDYPIPVHDVLLCQKLMIEGNEDRFLSVGRLTGYLPE